MKHMKYNNKINILLAFVFTAIGVLISSIEPASAQVLDDVTNSTAQSISPLSSLMAGGSYIMGALFGVLAILKFRGHVEAPTQVELKTPVIHLLTSGFLLAFPAMLRTIQETILPALTNQGTLDADNGRFGDIVEATINFGRLPVQNFNALLGNIDRSIDGVPGLLSAIAYLLGILLILSAFLKLKAHVESPQNIALRESVIRAIIGGLLLLAPFTLETLFNSLTGAGNGGVFGFLGQAYMVASGAGRVSEMGGGGACNITSAAGAFSGGRNSLGAVICSIWGSTLALPGFLTAVAYVFGIIVGIWGLLKIQDHVLNPQQTPIWDGLSRILVCAALFAFPTIISVTYNTIATAVVPHTNTADGAAVAVGGGLGLDVMLTNLMDNVFGPMSALLNWFGIIAGIVLVYIGITRLMKSAQEGARGPGGIGTIMTFVVGGALIAFSPMVTASSVSLFGTDGLRTAVRADLVYTAGLGAAEPRVEAVINAITRFVYVLGLISIMRGFFIMRAIAEGNGQASMMASVTHIVGGAIAVNLGPMINVVQTTLGINGVGIAYT